MANIGEMTGQRRCESCNKLFKPKEAWHKTCYDCAMKAREGGGKGASPPQSKLLQRYAAYLDQLDDQGYFNDKGYLRPELRVEDAEMVAQVLVNAKVTTSQLRRFFTMSRGLEQRLNAGQSFDSLIAEIASLQSFAAALVGKQPNIGQSDKLEVLNDFIKTNAQLSRRSEQAFQKGFIPHFESVIAYFTYHKPKSDKS